MSSEAKAVGPSPYWEKAGEGKMVLAFPSPAEIEAATKRRERRRQQAQEAWERERMRA